jgi:hypothetical protein
MIVLNPHKLFFFFLIFLFDVGKGKWDLQENKKQRQQSLSKDSWE